MSHNAKYYCKSLKRNPVKSSTLDNFFAKKKNIEGKETDQNVQFNVDESSSSTQSSSLVKNVNVPTSSQASLVVENPPTTVASTPPKRFKVAETNVTKNEIQTKDLRSSKGTYEKQFPDFYFSNTEEGWYCKTCSSFAQGVNKDTAFINKAGSFGDHPSRAVARHLASNRHQDAVKNSQAFKELSLRRTNVWEMLREASLASEIKNISTNRFVIKSFFRITFLLLKKHWAHTHNFKSLVELVSACGGNEIKLHLLNSPKNANYMSPEYIQKYIVIMDEYLKLPLLASIRSGYYTFYSDETQDITTTEQLAIYGTFEHVGTIREHFIGILPVSKLVGTTLSSANIMKVLENFFESNEILLSNCRFSCMDTTNVNSGEKSGLKRLLKHAVPMSVWIGCGNHKLALCFKHLLGDFLPISNTDATLLAIWKFFHYRPLAMNFLQDVAEAYNEHAVTPIAPSYTRWTAHERACKAVHDGYQQLLGALSVCLNERREPEAMGLFAALIEDEFIATLLLLRDGFEAIAPLNLALQKSSETLCLSNVKTYVEKTKDAINDLINGKRKYFKKGNFDKLKSLAAEQTSSLPPSANLRKSTTFTWEDFEEKTYINFFKRFLLEIDSAFEQLQFWLNFIILDPRKLPAQQQDLDFYGDVELLELLSFYSEDRKDRYKGAENYQAADIDKDVTLAEWPSFKNVMFQKRKAYEESIDKKIIECKDYQKVKEMRKSRSNYSPLLLWNDCKHDEVAKELYPSCMYLLHLLMIFPLSAACVERLFSKMKLLKTRLRNQLSQTSLESILRISTEAPIDGFSDSEYEHFVNELKKSNPRMKLTL